MKLLHFALNSLIDKVASFNEVYKERSSNEEMGF
jgi:hypothetical protein